MRTADHISGLLATRHAKDTWVAECNMGSAQAGCRRLDGWALLATWSPPTTIGYEIKVDRSDFLRDRKWEEYLPVCHELYFVCPAKLIQPEELPADVGLIWAGARLLTKRKAVRRDPDPVKLVRLMSYVLMSRTRIVADMYQAGAAKSQTDYWRRWLAEREEEQNLGVMVSRRVRRLVERAEARARAAENDRSRLEHVERRLHELGLDEKATTSWNLERSLNGGQRLTEIAALARQIEGLTR